MAPSPALTSGPSPPLTGPAGAWMGEPSLLLRASPVRGSIFVVPGQEYDKAPSGAASHTPCALELEMNKSSDSGLFSWLRASLLLSHRSLRICSFVAPRPAPKSLRHNPMIYSFPTPYMRLRDGNMSPATGLGVSRVVDSTNRSLLTELFGAPPNPSQYQSISVNRTKSPYVMEYLFCKTDRN